MSSFAKRLRSLRDKKSLTQKQVADHLGITESAYGFYEQGKREPSQSSLAKLSQLFEVPIDYLVMGKSVESTNEEQEFIEWLKGVDDVFFYEFNKSPEEQKKQFLETMRALWEIEKKRNMKKKE